MGVALLPIAFSVDWGCCTRAFLSIQVGGEGS
jgi:hypothetical protein